MSDLIYSGRVWKFGDNIDTDVISPGQYVSLPLEEQKPHCMEAVNPTFAKNVKPGDIVVAGRNFGCGSSRETAPEVLKELGVGAVVAESFARIFFRNAIAIGLPVLIVDGINKEVSEGDRLQLNLKTAEVKNLTTGKIMKGKPLIPLMIEIIEAGGSISLLQKRKS